VHHVIDQYVVSVERSRRVNIGSSNMNFSRTLLSTSFRLMKFSFVIYAREFSRRNSRCAITSFERTRRKTRSFLAIFAVKFFRIRKLCTLMKEFTSRPKSLVNIAQKLSAEKFYSARTSQSFISRRDCKCSSCNSVLKCCFTNF
jgi:hypothetical protein